MEKIISINGREVGFKATATTVKKYREKFNKDLFKDIQNLIPKVNDQSLGANELECFMNIAYVMAWQYDHSIPEDPDEWLDQFEMFDIYMILPQIIELWALNTEQLEKPKKSRSTERSMSTALFLLRCTEVGLSMADLDELTVGMVNDMFVEKSNDSYDWKEIANQDDFDRF